METIFSHLFFFLFSCRAYHVLSKRLLAVKVRIPVTLIKPQLLLLFCAQFNKIKSLLYVGVQVIPLDITVELQKQIMSELEILYKVGVSYFHLFLFIKTVGTSPS